MTFAYMPDTFPGGSRQRIPFTADHRGSRDSFPHGAKPQIEPTILNRQQAVFQNARPNKADRAHQRTILPRCPTYLQFHSPDCGHIKNVVTGAQNAKRKIYGLEAGKIVVVVTAGVAE